QMFAHAARKLNHTALTPVRFRSTISGNVNANSAEISVTTRLQTGCNESVTTPPTHARGPLISRLLSGRLRLYKEFKSLVIRETDDMRVFLGYQGCVANTFCAVPKVGTKYRTPLPPRRAGLCLPAGNSALRQVAFKNHFLQVECVLGFRT